MSKDIAIDVSHVYKRNLGLCLMDFILTYPLLQSFERILVWTLSLVFLKLQGFVIPPLWLWTNLVKWHTLFLATRWMVQVTLQAFSLEMWLNFMLYLVP